MIKLSFSYFDISIEKCQKSTRRKNCYPQEMIDKEPNSAILEYFYIDNKVNPLDKKEPIKSFFKNNIFEIQNESCNKIQSTINEIKIFTDDSLIFTNFKEEKTHCL